jgi:hypothetical protein
MNEGGSVAQGDGSGCSCIVGGIGILLFDKAEGSGCSCIVGDTGILLCDKAEGSGCSCIVGGRHTHV